MGILSDTHGMLRPAVIRAFQGVEVILHAGDVGDPAVLRELARVAPVHAVRGNMDKGALFEQLPSTHLLEMYGIHIYILHDLLRLDINPLATGLQMIVHGHTHRASIEQRQGVWYINPGPAGPAGDRSQPSVAVIQTHSGEIVPTIVHLFSSK